MRGRPDILEYAPRVELEAQIGDPPDVDPVAQEARILSLVGSMSRTAT